MSNIIESATKSNVLSASLVGKLTRKAITYGKKSEEAEKEYLKWTDELKLCGDPKQITNIARKLTQAQYRIKKFRDMRNQAMTYLPSEMLFEIQAEEQKRRMYYDKRETGRIS